MLEQEVDFLVDNPNYDYAIPVIIQVQRNFFAHTEALERRGGQRNENSLSSIHGYKARLNSRQIKQLLRSPLVHYVTLDAVVHPTDSDSDADSDSDRSRSQGTLAAIGADQANAVGYDGEGITVAVFDSGIKSHKDLDYRQRIKAVVEFTSGQPSVCDDGDSDSECRDDKYGHGTHVAGIIGGNGSKSYKKTLGIAPQVQFVDVRVLGSQGSGMTSTLIQAIDWTIQHKDQYGIQVANLSLGHAPLDSYTQDPLCQAVERMVQAGIVTVVSAGNLGKTQGYPKIWGGITSPGNDPEVITVSAIKTGGTATHADDQATSFGSRGPTYLDQLFKPDLCAPGNKIPGLKSSNTSWIAQHHGGLSIDPDYMYLSGSSMATAFVSGTAALVLQANPGLTPRLVKTVLSLSAIKLQQPHLLEQGNGLINAFTAVKLAEQVDPPNQRLINPVSPTWTLDGQEVWAGGAYAFGDRVYYGDLVDDTGTPVWGDASNWLNSILWSDNWNNSIVWSDSVFDSDSFIWNNSILWSDNWGRSIIWSDHWSNSIVWSDSIIWSDSIMWSDSIIWSDAETTGSATAFEGD